jgi:hypothetical protein
VFVQTEKKTVLTESYFSWFFPVPSGKNPQ